MLKHTLIRHLVQQVCVSFVVVNRRACSRRIRLFHVLELGWALGMGILGYWTATGIRNFVQKRQGCGVCLVCYPCSITF